VTCPATGECAAAGTYWITTSAGPASVGMILTGAGTSWTTQETAEPFADAPGYGGIACTATLQCVAVGANNHPDTMTIGSLAGT
jgi:hypothetical protein